MNLSALHRAVREQVRGSGSAPAPDGETFRHLSASQRAAFHALRRRLRRARTKGGLTPPSGSAIWY